MHRARTMASSFLIDSFELRTKAASFLGTVKIKEESRRRILNGDGRPRRG